MDWMKAGNGMLSRVETGKAYFAFMKEMAKLMGIFDYRVLIDTMIAYLEGEEFRTVDTLLEKAGFTKAELEKWWSSFSSESRNLLRQIKDVQGVQDFPLIRLPKKVDLDLDFQLDLGVTAQINAEMEIHDPRDEMVAPMDLEVDYGDLLLRFGLVGEWKINASASIPFHYGRVGFAGGFQGEAGLSFYFSHLAERMLIEALVEDIPKLPDPFNIKQIQALGQKSFKAVELRVNGLAHVGASVQAGHTWGASLNVVDDALQMENLVGIQAGVEAGFKADISIGGSYTLMVKPLQGNLIRVTLHREVMDEQNLEFNLESSVSIEGLQEMASRLVEKYIPDPEALMAKLEDFKNFPGYLQQSLEKALIGKGGLDDELSRSLTEILTGVGEREELAAILSSRVAQAAEEQTDLWVAELEELIPKLIDQALAPFPLSDKVREKLEQLLFKTIDNRIVQFFQDLRSTVLEILPSDKNKLIALLRPLQEVGENIEQLAEKIGENAEAVIDPLLKFLNKYQETRERILYALEGASRVKLGMTMSQSLELTKGNSVFLDLQLDAAVPGTDRFLRHIYGGSFAAVLEAAQAGDRGVSVLGGTFARFLKRKLTMGFNLNLFGIDLGSKTILQSEVRADYDLSGNAVIGASEARYQQSTRFYKEYQTVQFVNAYEFAGPEDKVINTAVSLSYSDEAMKAQDLENFLDALEQSGLIAHGVAQRTIGRFEGVGGQIASMRRSAEVSISMPITRQMIKRMGEASKETVVHAALRNQVTNLIVGTNNERNYTTILERFTQGEKVDQHNLAEVLMKLAPQDSDGHIRRQLNGLQAARWAHMTMMYMRALDFRSLTKMLEYLCEYEFHPDFFEEQIEELAENNRLIQKWVKPWLRAKSLLTGGINETVDRRTAAFFMTISELTADAESLPLMLPIIKWRLPDGGSSTEMLLF